MDKSLIENFVYQEKSASAKIPSMFRFIDSSKSVVFHCKVWLCDENEECKPNCVLKLDDPVGEDPEVVSKLLRSTDSEEITGASGSAPIPNQKNVASSLVHVLDQREVPTTMIPPTECELIFFGIFKYVYFIITGLDNFFQNLSKLLIF